MAQPAAQAEITRNNALEREARMPLVELPDTHVQCENCLLAVEKADLRRRGFVCPGCGDRVCVVCGCTDSVACPEGCEWVEPGLCSTHEEGGC